MKHLKKLSVALLATTLFSVSFTSCIDNEVSPIVEAIYEAQAGLIAAQAKVEESEAAYNLARAEAEKAQATLRNAQAETYLANAASTEAETEAYKAKAIEDLRHLVETNKNAEETALLVLTKAKKKLEEELLVLAESIRSKGATAAAAHLTNYAAEVANIETYTTSLLKAQGLLEDTKLYQKTFTRGTIDYTTTFDFYIALLNSDLATKKADLVAAETKLAGYIAAKNAPSAIKTQIADYEAQIKIANAKANDLILDITLAQKVKDDATAAKTAATAFMTSPTGPYFIADDALTMWTNNYKVDTAAVNTNTKLITKYTNAVNNYDGTTTTLKQAKKDAEAVVGNTHANIANRKGLLGTIQTKKEALGVPNNGGTPPTAMSAKLTGTAIVDKYDLLWNAQIDLAILKADYAALTANYNTAANNLSTAQITYGNGNFDTNIANAAQDVTDALNDLATAKTAYDDAKTAFEANPSGSVQTDTNLTNFDLGMVGLVDGPESPVDDLSTDHTRTYMRVSGWELVGPNTYAPKTFFAGKYQGGTSFIAAQQNLVDTSAADPLDNLAIAVLGDNVIITANVTDTEVLASTSVTASPTITKAYWVEVEAYDDNSTPLVTIFNNATNDLGTKITAPFYTGTTTRVYAADNTTGTKYAALWNAEKAKSAADWAKVNGTKALTDVEETYNYIKGLFEAGQAKIDASQVIVDGIVAEIGKVTTTTGTAAEKAPAGLLGEIEDLEAQLGADDYAGRATAGTTVLPISIVTPAPTGTEYLASAKYKTTFTAYAALWNAKNAEVDHLATTKAQYNTMLATAKADLNTATLEAAEDLIYIAKYKADKAALQAQYDALLKTPLYAALTVAVTTATQNYNKLTADKTAEESKVTALESLVTSLKLGVTDYTTMISTEQTAIATMKLQIADLEASIATAGEDLASEMNETVKTYEAEIAKLTAKIAASEALAAKYKALMDAALAS